MIPSICLEIQKSKNHDCATSCPRSRVHHAIAVNSSCCHALGVRASPRRACSRFVRWFRNTVNSELQNRHALTPSRSYALAVNVLLYGHCLSVAGMSKSNGSLASYVLVRFRCASRSSCLLWRAYHRLCRCLCILLHYPIDSCAPLWLSMALRGNLHQGPTAERNISDSSETIARHSLTFARAEYRASASRLAATS